MKIAISPQHKGRAICVCELCGTRFLSWIYREQRWCSRRCYDQARQLAMPSIEERLERFTDKSGGPDACWPWRGKLDINGYALVGVGRKWKRASHLVYSTYVGPVPGGLWLLHRCDNPACCNPRHLFLGTAQDNVDDMIAKGRHNVGPRPHAAVRRGEHCPSAKLTTTQVKEIHQLHAQGRTLAEVAMQFGVSKETVLDICRGRTWTHLHLPPVDGSRRGSAHGEARLTEQQVEAIRRLHASGAFGPALARQFAVGISTIYRITNGHSWQHTYDPDVPSKPAKRSRCKVTPEQAAQMRVLRAQGLSYEKIAARVGYNIATVWNVINDKFDYQ